MRRKHFFCAMGWVGMKKQEATCSRVFAARSVTAASGCRRTLGHFDGALLSRLGSFRRVCYVSHSRQDTAYSIEQSPCRLSLSAQTGMWCYCL